VREADARIWSALEHLSAQPVKLGGLGLCSMEETAAAAFVGGVKKAQSCSGRQESLGSVLNWRKS
jgi:hypothetical protein